MVGSGTFLDFAFISWIEILSIFSRLMDSSSGCVESIRIPFAPLSAAMTCTSLRVSCGESGIGARPAATAPKKAKA